MKKKQNRVLRKKKLKMNKRTVRVTKNLKIITGKDLTMLYAETDILISTDVFEKPSTNSCQ